MHSGSSLARLQQVTTLSLLLGALAWWGWHWAASPLLAVAGVAAILFFYSLALALEFVAMKFVGATDPALRPGWGELARAWLGETAMAPRVFCWRQPFRWRAVPDRLGPADAVHGRRGVLFIHGFVCNRGFWNSWMLRLRECGHAYVAVNLEPVFGSIESYVPLVERAVVQLTEASGMPPVLVCHSMGGLAARAWLRGAGPGRVHHIVTIGSPHHGTWLGRFSHVANGRQMNRGSEWLGGLRPPAGSLDYAAFTCWYSNCDNIVFPVGTATLPGADNRLVRGVAHVALGFHPEVMETTLALVTRPETT